jgi:hypothetical protein
VGERRGCGRYSEGQNVSTAIRTQRPVRQKNRERPDVRGKPPFSRVWQSVVAAGYGRGGPAGFRDRAVGRPMGVGQCDSGCLSVRWSAGGFPNCRPPPKPPRDVLFEHVVGHPVAPPGIRNPGTPPSACSIPRGGPFEGNSTGPGGLSADARVPSRSRPGGPSGPTARGGRSLRRQAAFDSPPTRPPGQVQTSSTDPVFPWRLRTVWMLKFKGLDRLSAELPC